MPVRAVAAGALPQLQSDQVELKYRQATAVPGRFPASIGPGGIEITPAANWTIDTSPLQSDQVELKFLYGDGHLTDPVRLQSDQVELK